MVNRLRGKLTYANVMSTVAVFVALGGSSYAALTITGRDVKNSSLTYQGPEAQHARRKPDQGIAARERCPGRATRHGWADSRPRGCC